MNSSVVRDRSEATVGRISIAYDDMGSGPAVIFCHGFPELAFSWRHQLPAISAAGYRAIALDMRGHGDSDAPPRVEDYTVMNTVGDVIGLMDVLGIQTAVLVGHDAGTTAAYNAALMRPDRIRGVVGLSVPFTPRGDMSRLEALAATPPGFYMKYFQEPGVAEEDLDADPHATLSRIFFHNSGEIPFDEPVHMIVSSGGTLVESLMSPHDPMGFVSEDDLAVYTEAYARTGFRGGLNGYRVFQRNWELLAPWNGMQLPVPAAYVGGTKDIVLTFPGSRESAAAMGPATGGPDAVFLEGAGHWIQAERPDEVNAAIIDFMRMLDAD